MDTVLTRLESGDISPEDGRRAGDLLRAAGRQSGDPHQRVHEIGVVDALVAALAERVGGIVYTLEKQHMEWLRNAGARITVKRVPF